MRPKTPKSDARTEMGRNLARKLYDEKLNKLVHMSETEKARLMAEYPKLGAAEFNNVLEQVIAARRYQQERIGWQAVPHDVTVLVFIAVTYLVNLRMGVIVGIGTLVLLESLFQFYFDRRLYQYWLTCCICGDIRWFGSPSPLPSPGGALSCLESWRAFRFASLWKRKPKALKMLPV